MSSFPLDQLPPELLFQLGLALKDEDTSHMDVTSLVRFHRLYTTQILSCDSLTSKGENEQAFS
jgi:hypothetical protein